VWAWLFPYYIEFKMVVKYFSVKSWPLFFDTKIMTVIRIPTLSLIWVYKGFANSSTYHKKNVSLWRGKLQEPHAITRGIFLLEENFTRLKNIDLKWLKSKTCMNAHDAIHHQLLFLSFFTYSLEIHQRERARERESKITTHTLISPHYSQQPSLFHFQFL
jgi:hypothetical protein